MIKAIIRPKGGKNLSTMEVSTIPSPTLGAQQVRLKMASSRINPVDIDLMKGMPFLKYKKPQIGGIDGAGSILEVGSLVKGFQAGDEVFFYRAFTDIGSWAEEVVLNASDIAHIPNKLSLQDAGAIALPLLTAYESLAQLGARQGEKILIHAGAGGVGFMAVQLAKQMGLEVITTASKNDFPLLEGLGLARLIDYRTEDFATIIAPGEVDYIFDLVGGETLSQSITLMPRKLISVNYPDVDKLGKTGIKMPGLLKGIMRFATSKYPRSARKAGVSLIGQVTGPNGKLLQEASDVVEKISSFKLKPYPILTFDEVERSGMANTRPGTVLLMG
ncbi:MAG: NADP-dependent oxidoreductase [Bacteroidota bacterium]